VYIYAMNAVHNYPWLTWTWIFAIIARIQLGNQTGVLQMIEIICQSSFETIDEVCFFDDY
jgi:hypothetical protein